MLIFPIEGGQDTARELGIFGGAAEPPVGADEGGGSAAPIDRQRLGGACPFQPVESFRRHRNAHRSNRESPDLPAE